MSRALQTYAPASFYKATEEFVQPTMGSGVEISVAWKERIIGTYNFHQSGNISIGTHPSSDIQLPLLNSFVDKIPLVKIDYGIEILLPPEMKSQLGRVDEKGQFSLSDVGPNAPIMRLGQKELLQLHMTDSLKIIIRPSQATVAPKIIPFFDLSSDGFLSLIFAFTLALIMAVAVKLNPVGDKLSPFDEAYSSPLLLINPPRTAKVIIPKPKIDMSKIIKKPKQIIVNPMQNNASGKLSPKTKSSGNKTKAQSLVKNQNKTRNKVGAKFEKGKSIKSSVKPNSQAKSPDVSKSKIFSTFGTSGRRKSIDKGYVGNGMLAGLANKATNSAGDNIDRPGESYGSKFREAGSNRNGNSNVGVEGLSGGTGLGPGLGETRLGRKQSVSVIPSGEGALFSGTIDREGIRKVFFDNASAIRSCYERTLIKNTSLSGKLMLDFDIGPGGQVVGRPKTNRNSSTFYNIAMSECLLNKLKSWRFPDPPSGQVVNVLYPLAFSSGK